MTIIPAAQWTPDQPDLVNQGSSTIKNVLPQTAVSYGPMASLVPYSAALTARCQGAISLQDAAATVYAFAGDVSKLYELTIGSTSFADVSKVGGYNAPNDGQWHFTFWTPNLVLTTDYQDPVQAFTIGTSTVFADLAAGAPNAKYIAVIRDFVMLFNTLDATDGARVTRAWWSAIGAPDSWPTPGTSAAVSVQSDFQDVNLGDFGQGMGIVGGLGSADGALLFERGLVRIEYVGAGSIFAFQAVEGGRGCAAAGSIAQLGAFVIFLGPDDLYLFDGSSCVPLGTQQFSRTIYDEIDANKLDRVTAAFDPVTQIYFMAYPGAGAVAGNPNKILAYHWILKRATLIDAVGDVEILFRSLSYGLTLEQMDSVAASIDSQTISFDSRAWTGGSMIMSAFDASHRLGYLNGPALAPTVDTSEAQIVKNRRAYVSAVRPLVDGGAPMVQVAVRDRMTDAKTWKPATAMSRIGDTPQRASGRYHTARITLPPGGGWTSIFGVDVPDDAVSSDGDA